MPKPLTKLVRMPHQYQALQAIASRDNVLCEYGTGTGKTLILVETCKLLVSLGDVPIILAVPNSLIEQTYDEFLVWAGVSWTERNIAVLGTGVSIYQRREQLKRGRHNVYLISHESFSYKEIREGLYYRKWAAALIDEGSRFRNYSKRTVTLKALGSKSLSRYVFTGRLMVRTPADVFYVMNFLDPKLFGTMNREIFVREYCIMGGYGGDQAVGIRPEKLGQLKEIMDAHSIRCELRDIREMPERELIVYKVDMLPAQRKAYHEMRDTLSLEIERLAEPEFKSKAKTYATRLQRLQEIAAGFARNIDGDVINLPSPKTAETMNILEDTPDVPTIVWYWWIPERDRIATELKRRRIPFSIFGFPDAQAQFQSGRTNVFLAQLARGGYGLNLPRALRMIYHSLPWDLDCYLQSQERNVRLNTTAKYLSIIHIVGRDTADEYVRSKLLDKAGISSLLSKSQALELLRGIM